MKNYRVALIIAMLLLAVSVRPAAASGLQGRWEFVHTSGDSLAQWNSAAGTGFPGQFSTYLTSSGVGLTYLTLDSLACDQTENITPTWTAVGENQYRITFTVTGNPAGTFQFIYTGTYTTHYQRTAKGGGSVYVTAVYGNYTTTGNVSACSSGSGQFVATYFPDVPATSYTGNLEAAYPPPMADQPSIATTLNFSAPSTQGGLAGTIDVGTMTYQGQACFTPVSGDHTLNIDSAASYQSGMMVMVYATDGNGVRVLLSGFSANFVPETGDETDPYGYKLTGGEGVGAAVGEDDPDDGIKGIANDGANNYFVFLYGISGGPCDGVGGGDDPFVPRSKSKHVSPKIPDCSKRNHQYSGAHNPPPCVLTRPRHAWQQHRHG